MIRPYIHIDTHDDFLRESFDKKAVRKGMRKAGYIVTKEARSLVRKGGGKYPSRKTGELMRSITSKVSRSGFMVKIEPRKTSQMKDFYPAFLHYGVTGKPRRRDHRSQVKNGIWRIKPYENYMADALENKTGEVKQVLSAMMQEALK